MYPARRVPSFILHGCRFGAPDRFRTCDSAFGGAAARPDRCLLDIVNLVSRQQRKDWHSVRKRACVWIFRGAKAPPGRPLAPAIAPRAIQGLRTSGVSRIVMLTGDRAETAEAIGAALDLDFSPLRPRPGRQGRSGRG